MRDDPFGKNGLRGLDLFKNVPGGRCEDSSKVGCGDPKPPIPNTLPLHAGSAEIGPNLATTYTELGSSGVRVLMTEV